MKRRINKKICALCGRTYEQKGPGNDEGVCLPCDVKLSAFFASCPPGFTDEFFKTAMRIDFPKVPVNAQ